MIKRRHAIAGAVVAAAAEQQPAQPDTFAPPLATHLIHAVVPVTAANQRQAALTAQTDSQI